MVFSITFTSIKKKLYNIYKFDSYILIVFLLIVRFITKDNLVEKLTGVNKWSLRLPRMELKHSELFLIAN